MDLPFFKHAKSSVSVATPESQKKTTVGGVFNPFEKISVKLDIFPHRGENKQIFETRT